MRHDPVAPGEHFPRNLGIAALVRLQQTEVETRYRSGPGGRSGAGATATGLRSVRSGCPGTRAGPQERAQSSKCAAGRSSANVLRDGSRPDHRTEGRCGQPEPACGLFLLEMTNLGYSFRRFGLGLRDTNDPYSSTGFARDREPAVRAALGRSADFEVELMLGRGDPKGTVAAGTQTLTAAPTLILKDKEDGEVLVGVLRMMNNGGMLPVGRTVRSSRRPSREAGSGSTSVRPT